MQHAGIAQRTSALPHDGGAQQNPPVIGVLGGMGPAATADFYRKIVRATPAERDQDHPRTLIWSDPSIPDRATAFLADGPDPVPALIDGARLLEDGGAAFIAVPCNSAHLFLAPVREAVRIPILDMIDETASAIVAAGSTAVALLATEATHASGSYARRLRDRGVSLLEPNDDERQCVSAAIRAVKAGDDDEAPALLSPIAARLLDAGASTIIAGCTELPMAFEMLPGVPVTDPTAILARACVRMIQST